MADSLESPFAGIDVSDLVKRERPTLRDIYESVATGDPDQAAKVMRLSSQIGQPSAFVNQNQEQSEKAAAVPADSIFEDIEKNHPVAAKFLSDPRNMAVLHDDIGNLAAHEYLTNEVRSARTILEALEAGYQESSIGLIERMKLPTLSLDEQANLTKRLAFQAGALAGDFPAMVLGGFAASPGGPVAAGAAAFALPTAIREMVREHYLNGNIASAQELLDRTYKIAKATTKSGIVGAATAGIGIIAKPLGAAAKFGSEVATMTTAGAALEARLPQPAEFAETAILIGGLHGAGKVAGLAHSRWAEARKVEAEQKFYRAMGATAEASKLRERLPEQHQALIKELTNGTPVENVHIPIDAWDLHFQGANIDPQQAAQQMGVEKAYSEAKATGESVKIPLDTWINKLVGTKHYDAFSGDIKFDPDGLTPNQIKARDAAIGEQIKTEQAAAGEAIAADAALKKGHDLILEDVKRQLAESGRLAGYKGREKIIESQARIVAAHYTTEAIRRGVDAEQLYRSDFPQVVGAELIGGPGAIEQPAFHGSPFKFQKFTVQKIGTGEGVQQYGWGLYFAGRKEVAEHYRDTLTDVPADYKLKGKSVMKMYESEALRSSDPDWAGVMENILLHETPADLREHYTVENGYSPELVERVKAIKEEDLKAYDADGKEISRGFLYKVEVPEDADLLDLDVGIARQSPKVKKILEKLGLRKEMPNASGMAVYHALADRLGGPEKASRYLAEQGVPGMRYLDEQSRAEGKGTSNYVIFDERFIKSQELLFQSGAVAPTFYSKLQRDIESRLPEKATPGQIQALLREAKEDEVKWSGINEFMAGKEKINKAELLEFLRAHQLEIKEIEKPSPEAFKEEQRKLIAIPETERTSEQMTRLEQLIGRSGEGEAKFAEYQLPGGQNYRELLLLMPTEPAIPFSLDEFVQSKGIKDYSSLTPRAQHEALAEYEKIKSTALSKKGGPKPFHSLHFDEPNILAHVRFNDRVDSEGKRVLFIEELQSDWHQKGRKYGYRGERREAPLTENEKSRLAELQQIIDASPRGREVLDEIEGREYDDLAGRQFAGSETSKVPDAPFRKTWHEFALKRMIRYAAENGYDKLAWTTGEQQVERYDLSKQVDSVHYRVIPVEEGVAEQPVYQVWATAKDSYRRIEIGEHPAARLPDVVGKDLADKIIAGAETSGTRDRRGFAAATGEDFKTLDGIDLKVGGEGMKGFYDKILPSFLNKFGKKWGAEVGKVDMKLADEMVLKFKRAILDKESGRWRIELSDGDLWGSFASEKEAIKRYHDEFKPEGITAHALPITEELRNAALQEGFPLFQGERGFFDAQRKVIGLMQSADPSTFLHESAHAWLESSFQFVKSGQATQEYLERWADAKKWLGIADDQESLTRDQQEKFSQGFERYLLEGEAPSEGLRAVFTQLRRWLTQIYRSLRGLPEISDEARRYFDRMLATEEEIAAAARESGYKLGEIADLPELEPETRNRIRTLQERAHQIAEDTLLKEQMASLKAENRAFLGEERGRLTESVKTQLENEPLYRAMADLKEGAPAGARQFGLDGLVNRFVADVASDVEKAHFEAVAELYGFQDGADLARQAQGAKPLSEAILGRVEAGLARFAEMADTEAIRQAALEAIHTDRAAELLALEQQALEDLAQKRAFGQELAKSRRVGAKVAAEAAKRQAQELLASKPIREAGAFRPYFTAERNAAVRVSKALADGDYEKAAAAKQQQMLNHALASEALRNRKEIERRMRGLDKYAERGDDLLNMPYAFTSQIDQLLAERGLADPRDPAQQQTLLKIALDMEAKKAHPQDIANATGYLKNADGKWRRESLPEFVQRVNDNYYAMVLPDSLLMRQQLAQGPAYLSLAELRELSEAVKNIAAVGRSFERFLSDFLKVDIREAARQFRERVEAEIGTPYEQRLLIGKPDVSKLREIVDAISLDAFIPSQVNMLTLAKYLDGGADDGPAHQFIYRPMEMAERSKLARQQKAIGNANDLLARFWKPEELAAYKDQHVATITVQTEKGAFRQKLTHEDAFVILLNWGNESSRKRIMDGFGANEATVQGIINLLPKKDFDAAQAIWDHLESYWPEIAALEMKVNGIEPERVQAVSVLSPHGDYKGGYYPIAYDFEKSAQAYKNAEQRNALWKQYSSAVAHTEHGFTIARENKVVRSVRLNFAEVLTGHLEDVVHDLSFREAVIDVARFLRQPDTEMAILNAIGPKGFNSINRWLMDVASMQGEPLTFADKTFRWFRFGTTFATLGYRAFTLPIDVASNLLTTLGEIGPQRLGSAIKDFVSDPTGIYNLVNTKSERMRIRATMRERDIADIAKRWRGQESAFRAFAFSVQAGADMAVSYPLWNEVYKRELSKHGDEIKAVNIADETVTRTIGSGSILDQVGAQRGTEKMKILSMYYSWLSMQFNRAWLAGKMAGLAYEKGNTGTAIGITAKAALFTWVLQSVNENLWREWFRNIPEGQEDEDRKKRRIMARFLQQPFSYIWLARDIAGFVISSALKQPGADYKFSPMEQAIENLLTPPAKAMQIAFSDDKELDQKFVEDAARAAAIATPYPQKLNDVVFNFVDFINNEGELTWRDFLTRRVKK